MKPDKDFWKQHTPCLVISFPPGYDITHAYEEVKRTGFCVVRASLQRQALAEGMSRHQSTRPKESTQ
jgi:hypothetical protein